MRIQKNIPALNALSNLTKNNKLASKSIEKVASGLKINRAADDVAGLGVSEKMKVQIRELEMVDSNITQGVSVAQTADGALQEITSILQRTRELSVQASNGVYDEAVDRVAIDKEIAGLLTEVECISKNSSFNDIPLFLGKIEKMFTDTIVNIPPTVWGNLDFIHPTDFGPAQQSVPAVLELPLNGVTSASDLVGKSFTFKSGTGSVQNIYFCDNATVNKVPNGYTAVNIQSSLSTPGFAGVQSAFNSFGLYSARVTVVNGMPMTAKFTHDLRDLTVSVTNPDYHNVISQGAGAWGNSATVSGPAAGGGLLEIDSANNQFVYANDKQATVNFPMAGSTALDFSNLSKNTLTVGNFSIHFGSGTTSGNNIYIPQANCGSLDAIKSYLVGLGSVTNGNRTLDFAADGSNIKLTMTDSATSLVDSNVRVYETTTLISTNPPTYEADTTKANATVSLISAGTNEKNADYELTVPDLVHNSDFTFSDSLGGGFSIYIYDSSRTAVPNQTPNVGGYMFDMKGKTKDDLSEYIAARMGRYIKVSEDGSTIKFSYPTNQIHSISISGGGKKPYYPGSSTYSSPVFAASRYLDMEPASIDLDFDSYFTGGTLDKDALSKRGFKINGVIYKFTTPGSPAVSGQTEIDISGCTDIDSLKAALDKTLTGFTASNAGNKITLTTKLGRTTYSSKISFVDGIEGVSSLFDLPSGSVNLSGGLDTGSSEAIIDLGSITTKEHIEQLRNTGFRVRCASCPGEFINVLFIGKSTPPIEVPPFYQKEDPPGSGNKIAIKNIVIKMDEISDPSQFANEIVRQANATNPLTGNPYLDHFTGMRVDPDDPTKLIAYDKRKGDLPSATPPGIDRGKVETGIEADFTIDTDTWDLQVDQSIQIYVGSFDEHQYIDIKLPTLGLVELGLNDVDVRTIENSNKLLDKVNSAINTISAFRGDIGAASNRLDHCKEISANTKANTTFAYSQIKDADIAKEIMNVTKYNILNEAATAMLAQANAKPQSVLQLLQ